MIYGITGEAEEDNKMAEMIEYTCIIYCERRRFQLTLRDCQQIGGDIIVVIVVVCFDELSLIVVESCCCLFYLAS